MHWFYLKDDLAAPLPVFSGRLVEEAPPSWPWGPPIKEKKRMCDLLEAIVFLKNHGLRGANVIGGYHARRVAPLMLCVLPLYGIMLGVQLIETMLAQGLLYDSEATLCIKEATRRPTPCSQS